MSDINEVYGALPLQIGCDAINSCPDVETARQSMMNKITHCSEMVRGASAFVRSFSGDPVRLVVLPEYFLTGFPMGESIPDWQAKACLRADGPEYEALGQLAVDNRVFLSGNAYEVDDNFPNIYFQTSFIINDSGDVILRYRRLISMYAVTPHDILDEYLDRYGADSLFPVVNTELGRLACVASEEILYPEITRALALKGAEVICHSSSEVGSPLLTPKNIAKRARAYENKVYIVSANSGGIAGIAIPEHSTNGHSQVVDYHGQVLAEAGSGETMTGHAPIDIASQQRHRGKPAMTNTLARQRLELFRDVYSGAAVYPANTLLENGVVKAPDRTHFVQTQQAAIDALKNRGVI